MTPDPPTEEIPMATTSQHIAARNDPDLVARFVAAAEMAGITEAESKVRTAIGKLVTVVVGEDGNGLPQTIADVHAYAADVRQQYLDQDQALPPGLNPGAVTDVYLAAAVATLVPASTPTE